jgi:DNA-binding winged helix-turn-helix (wHTH) protein/pimeloyl-ACP methyl ester carboxylesterase
VTAVFRFGGYELEPAARELRSKSGTVHVEQQVFDVLRYLAEHRDRVVPKTELLDEVWGDRFVSESALTSRIKSARRAVGDSGERQQVIKTVHGVGYRFVADVDALQRDGAEGGLLNVDLRIRFVEVEGGVSLAVAETGEGPYHVKTATWLTQVDKDTDNSPVWGHWVRALSRRYRYVRYDPRGCGLSDRDLAGHDLSNLDLWIDDLRRVVDELGQESVALLGVSQGGPIAVGFAARYPERVSHLILFGTYARGMKRRGDPVQSEAADLQVDLARVGWGTDNDSFREIFARQFVPDAQSDEIEWFNNQLHTTTNSTNAPLLEGAFHDVDVSDLARQVVTPTLVQHAVRDRAVPFEEGRHLAGLIPGARFVPLESRNHILLQRDAAFPQFINEIERFTST